MLIDLAKLLLSKDARESVQTVIASLKRSPTWQTDLLEVSESFKREKRDLTDVLVKFTMGVLLEKGWSTERIGVAEFVATELITNAFVHGLKNDPAGSVRVGARLTSHWAEYRVEDRGDDFNLDETLKNQAEAPHGLWFVRLAASTLVQPKEGVVIARVDKIASKQSALDDGEIVVVSFKGRLEHSNAHEAQQLLNSLPKPSRVVVDLSELEYISSIGLRVFMIFAKEKRLSSFLSDCVVFLLPEGRVVVREIFDIARMQHVLPIAKTMEAAREIVIRPKSESFNLSRRP